MELPTGTVTLLFSDMEGSTRLLSRLGSAYPEALDAQRVLLRRAWAAHDGVELGTEGDSFFVAFANPAAAVAAAVEGQRAVEQAEWPAGERVRVRMGIHTGSPLRHGDGYVGMDVHRAARVAAASYGGQVLVTEATAAAIRSDSIGFRDLGRHTLKDIPQPEHLFQVEAPGLDTDFPPVRGVGSAANLPVWATPLVGRETALDEIAALLSAPHLRLLTLTGPGGTGKTRLATAAAGRNAGNYAHGVYFVALESVTSAQVMWTAIATALEVPPDRREPPRLFDHLADKSILLVLDNLEQVQGADTVIRELQRAVPGVRVVATSRHPLHLPGEQEYAVAPLGVPDTDGGPAESAAAVQLFVSSAKLVRSSFELTPDNRAAVQEICRRLDGLPLALELAAAKVKLLSPQALLTRLDRALDLRSPDTARAGRQQTLRQTIAWSHDLLAADAQRMFRCLSVFPAGVDVPAVEAVWAAVDTSGNDVLDVLQELLDASLVTVAEGDEAEPRVSMLNTVAAFAREQLRASADEVAAHEAAAFHLDDLIQRMAGEPLVPGWRQRLTARLDTELDNYRGCLTWLLAKISPDPAGVRRLDVVLAMAFSLNLWLCYWRGYLVEGSQWLEAAIVAAGERRDLRVAGCVGQLAFNRLMTGEVEASAAHAEKAYAMLQEGASGQGLSARQVDLLGFVVRNAFASAQATVGHRSVAEEVFLELAERTVDPGLNSVALTNLGFLHYVQGEFDEAYPYVEAARRMAEAAGDASLLGMAGEAIASLDRLRGRLSEAERGFRETIPLVLASQDRMLQITFAEDFAALLAELHHPEEAATLFGAAEAARRQSGVRMEELAVQYLTPALRVAETELGDRWPKLVALAAELTVEQAIRHVAEGAPRPASWDGAIT